MHRINLRPTRILFVITTFLTLVGSVQAQSRKETELESLLKESQLMILDLEKKLKLLAIEKDSLQETCEVELRFERETNKLKLAAANDKLELRRIFTDSIRAVEREKYNEMKAFLMDKAKRRWYESPYLFLAVGFIGGVVLDR